MITREFCSRTAATSLRRPNPAPGAFLQRAAQDRLPLRAVPGAVGEALRTPGRPLDPAVRTLMEPRLGFDFSRVRVHTDGRAAESAEAVHALAYTVGEDVVFGAGRYSPETAAGRKLLAHELAHVVQQGSLEPPMRNPAGMRPAGQQGGMIIGMGGDERFERAAQVAAERFGSGGGLDLAPGSAPAGLQRAEDAGKDPSSEDVCAKQENDPESFSIMAAKHFLNEVDPSPSRMAQSATCEAAGPDGDRMECDVTFSDGQKIHVTWIKSLNNVEAQRPTKDDRQWCVYHYVCNPDGTIDYQKKGCSPNAGGMPRQQSGPTMVGAAGAPGPGGRV